MSLDCEIWLLQVIVSHLTMNKNLPIVVIGAVAAGTAGIYAYRKKKAGPEVKIEAPKVEVLESGSKEAEKVATNLKRHLN